ncbi:MAG: hypothetical protein ACLPUG_05745 [Acidimicrobiales bacterium]
MSGLGRARDGARAAGTWVGRAVEARAGEVVVPVERLERAFGVARVAGVTICDIRVTN